MRAYVFALLLLLASACTGGQEPDGIGVTGGWRGTTVYGDSAYPVALELRLVDREGDIRGTGSMKFPDNESYPLSVEGIRDVRALILRLLVGSYYPVTAWGDAYPDSLVLALTGSGFQGERALLLKLADGAR